MYVHAIDETHAIHLGIYAGSKDARDIDSHAESFLYVDAIAHAQHRGALFVVVPEPEYPTPDSRDRRRFASLKDACRGSPSLFILVTPSALLRGVLTAVTWLSPPNERWRAVATDSITTALVHAEKFRPGCARSLQRMDRELREGLRMRDVG